MIAVTNNVIRPFRELTYLLTSDYTEAPGGWSKFTNYDRYVGTVFDDFFPGNLITPNYRECTLWLETGVYNNNGNRPEHNLTWLGPDGSGSMNDTGTAESPIGNINTSQNIWFTDCPNVGDVIPYGTAFKVKIRVPKDMSPYYTGYYPRLGYIFKDNVTNVNMFTQISLYSGVLPEDYFPEIKIAYGNQIVRYNSPTHDYITYPEGISVPVEMSGGVPVDREEVVWAELEEYHLSNGGPPPVGFNYNVWTCPCISVCGNMPPKDPFLGDIQMVPTFFFSTGLANPSSSSVASGDWLESQNYPHSFGPIEPLDYDKSGWRQNYYIYGAGSAPKNIVQNNYIKMELQNYGYPGFRKASEFTGEHAINLGNGWWQYAAIPILPRIEIGDPDDAPFNVRMHTFWARNSFYHNGFLGGNAYTDHIGGFVPNPYGGIDNEGYTDLRYTIWDRRGKEFTIGPANSQMGWLIGMIPMFGIG